MRLDVYADDEEGTVFDVEMQTTDKKNLPKRSRFYQGQMDMATLRPGTDFNDLPKSYVIFICTFDPFGERRYRYTCVTHCRETQKELQDEAYKVFLSTKGQNDEEESPELVRFLRYIGDSACMEENQEDGLIHRIEIKIADIKRSRGMEVRYMLFSEMLSDERKEGRLEGLQEGQCRMLKLMESMEAGGDADKIPLLYRDPDFLQKMYDKYHTEV